MKTKYFFGILGLAFVTVLMATLSGVSKGLLHLVACDVGQGDAILIYRGTTQILVDGGAGDRVLTCLSEHLPFWDRKIELIVVTHPQEDHFGGVIEVFQRYKVENMLTNTLDSSGQGYQVLKNVVGGSQTRVLAASSRQDIRLDLIYLDVIWPTDRFLANESQTKSNPGARQVLGSSSTAKDPNDFSVVINLAYKEFDALLTGDIGPSVINDILATGTLKDVEYLKVPHHGSKNGLTESLLVVVKPEVAVISSGKNPWGHPHKETLDLLSGQGVKILRTDEGEAVEVVTDGSTWQVR